MESTKMLNWKEETQTIAYIYCDCFKVEFLEFGAKEVRVCVRIEEDWHHLSNFHTKEDAMQFVENLTTKITTIPEEGNNEKN